MKIEKVNINELKLNKNNPRSINKDKMKKLIKSINNFPEMLEVRPMVVDETMTVLGGNMRLKACQEIGLEEVYIIKFNDLNDKKKKEFIIKDNVGYGEWEWETLEEEWDIEQLEEWGLDIEKSSKVFKEDVISKLSDRFIVPPFSVLDTRQGDWQERKKNWKYLIQDDGQSRENTHNNRQSIYKNMKGGVSILDPVISEVICHWFAPENSNIIDPFAGDTVFGFVSSYIGHNFKGIEIRQEQCDLNNEKTNDKAIYFCDDGQNILKYIEPNSQDMIFSCPPYFNLEEYSKLENDASNQDSYEDFIKILDNTFTDSIKCLKNNRFATIIVGDMRDKNGEYYSFHEDIKYIFKKNGMILYNEMILVEPVGLNAMRANRSMSTRKVPKVHQNVLVFYKPEEEPQMIESIYRKVFVFFKGEYKDIQNDFENFDYKNIDVEDESTDV